MDTNEISIDHGYLRFCSGHPLIYYSKKIIIILLAKLHVVNIISNTITVIFGKRNLIGYVITILLMKYWNNPEVFINFDVGRKNVLAMILASFIVLPIW